MTVVTFKGKLWLTSRKRFTIRRVIESEDRSALGTLLRRTVVPRAPSLLATSNQTKDSLLSLSSCSTVSHSIGAFPL